MIECLKRARTAGEIAYPRNAVKFVFPSNAAAGHLIWHQADIGGPITRDTSDDGAGLSIPVRSSSALTHSEGTGMRLILARMISAGLVQRKGLGFSLCSWM